MPKKVTIIIITYNGLKWIDKCLESCGNFSVVVVDNNSSDGTVDFINLNYPKVHLIEQDKNIGFGQANNIGISYALKRGAEYVFLLNQDAYLVNDCLKRLIKVQNNNKEYGVLSPIHLNGDGKKLDYKFSNYMIKSPDFYSDHVLNKSLNNIYEVSFVNAAGWLISLECLKTVGGFDPIFFHYGEDNNYCQRVKYHGLRIGVVPDVFIMHDRTQSKRQKVDSIILKERMYKMEYGNPERKDFEAQFSKKIEITKRSIFKNKIILRSLELQELKKHLEMLLRVQKEISNSRKIALERGAHFLRINE